MISPFFGWWNSIISPFLGWLLYKTPMLNPHGLILFPRSNWSNFRQETHQRAGSRHARRSRWWRFAAASPHELSSAWRSLLGLYYSIIYPSNICRCIYIYICIYIYTYICMYMCKRHTVRISCVIHMFIDVYHNLYIYSCIWYHMYPSS